MSNSYRILCLSHDPAIILEPDWTDIAPALATAYDPAEHIEIAHHAGCDLLIGAWNNGLAAFGCPPRLDPLHRPTHIHPEWINVDMMRVLVAAYETALPAPDLTGALKRIPACWSSDRLHRLRELLRPAPVGEPVGV